MIIHIRKFFKTRTFKVILWTIFFAVSGILAFVWNVIERYTGTSKGRSSWVLDINKEAISLSEFRRSVMDQEERIRIMRAQYGQYADLYFQMMGMKINPQEMALNALVSRTLLNQVASKLPFWVSPKVAQSQLNNPLFISQEISDLVPFFTWDQSLGGVNPLMLQSYLHHIGVSEAEFNDQLAKAVARHEARKLVEHGSYVPEFELKEKFAQNFLGHKFSIMTISHTDILDQVKKEAAGDEVLKAYYDHANSKERRYYAPEMRSAFVTTFDPLTYGIAVSDQEIEKYYNNNKAQFVEKPAQVHVRRILFKITDPSKENEVKAQAEKLQQELAKNPEQFGPKAKEFSQDQNTASQGGLMPLFSKGTHDPIFERTSFLLKENNDISSVIRTKEGFEIVQRVDKKMQTFKPISQVSKNIKETLTKKKFGGQFSSDMRSLMNADAKTESEFIAKHSGKASVVKNEAATNTTLSKTIFKLKEHGQKSFYQEGEKGILVVLDGITQSNLPSFEQIKNKVKEDYYKDQATKKIAQLLDQVKTNPALFDKPLPGMKVEKTGFIRHSHDYKEDQKEKEALGKKGIDLGKIFQIENKGGVALINQGQNGVAVRLDEITPFDAELFAQKKALLKEQEQQQNRSLVMTGFVASLYRNAKIKKNESQIRIES